MPTQEASFRAPQDGSRLIKEPLTKATSRSGAHGARNAALARNVSFGIERLAWFLLVGPPEHMSCCYVFQGEDNNWWEDPPSARAELTEHAYERSSP